MRPITDFEKKPHKIISLRTPLDLLKQIHDQLIMRASLTRTAWILEAIQEKLRKINE